MDHAVRNLMEFAKVDLQQAVRAATINPSRIVRAEKIGVLETGANADFVVLTATGEVRATVIKGEVLQ
jgi:N-acetylglucosamine-6-phosphate deacetylase